MTLPTALSATLPPWLVAELPALPTELADDASAMTLVNALADRNWRAGNGGPFAAAVVDHDTRTLVSVGVNVVLSSGLSGMHAEVMALGLAQVGVGTWDLAAERDLELVVNWRPCAMCFGAALWSGVRHLVIAGDGPECEQLTGFDEGPLLATWRDELGRRGIRVVENVERDAATAVFAAYGASDAIVYNARSEGPSAV
jgi:tRNA(Arg) A34 adenosine deaminase TadA